MTCVLVVGASGFVGQVVVRDLLRRGKKVVAAARRPDGLPQEVQYVPLPDLTQPVTNWSHILDGVESVVYLAARVHVLDDPHPDPLAAYRAVNLQAAVSLATAAKQAGVRRFVYLSSVKVSGEQSTRPLTELDQPRPTDPYGISKWEAEQALVALGRKIDLEVVVLRPPLVYGPGVKANLMMLAKAAGKGWPLPVGAVRNSRSMIYVENLADVIALVLDHPGAAGETYFVSDGQDLATAELTRQLAEAQGTRARLPKIPVPLLWALGRMTGKTAMVQRLVGSLQVSSRKVQDQLGWQPPYPVWQALARTGRSLKEDPVSSMNVTSHALTARQRRYLRMRTLVERVLAMAFLMGLAPLLLALTIWIRIDSRGSALFIQPRAGKLHQPFQIYKFRTMHLGTPHLSTEDMQRSNINPITRVGKFLRRTSLDELPQLLNVLRGEMSFVGPRPALMTQETVLSLREQAGVNELLPGITGHAQVTGRDDLTDLEKVRRDTEYLRQVSLQTDLKIVFLTLSAMRHGTGNK